MANAAVKPLVVLLKLAVGKGCTVTAVNCWVLLMPAALLTINKAA